MTPLILALIFSGVLVIVYGLALVGSGRPWLVRLGWALIGAALGCWVAAFWVPVALS